VSYEEEDTCVSYEEEDTCVSYEEEDTCVSYEEESPVTRQRLVKILQDIWGGGYMRVIWEIETGQDST
jgi:hypothetical protein